MLVKHLEFGPELAFSGVRHYETEQREKHEVQKLNRSFDGVTADFKRGKFGRPRCCAGFFGRIGTTSPGVFARPVERHGSAHRALSG